MFSRRHIFPLLVALAIFPNRAFAYVYCQDDTGTWFRYKDVCNGVINPQCGTITTGQMHFSECKDAGVDQLAGPPDPQEANPAPTGTAAGCCVPGSRHTVWHCMLKTDAGTADVEITPSTPDCPDSTASGTSTVGTVNTTTQGTDSQLMKDAANNSSGSQSDSLGASDAVISLGGNQAATMGALFCAEGANRAVEDPSLSGQDIRNCQDNFRTANEMKSMQEKMGKQGGFSPDPAAMNQDGTKSTLDAFTRNFGIEGDEYMRRMLGSKGSMGDFADMLKSRLSDDQIRAAMAAADSAQGNAEDSSRFAVDFGGKNGMGKKDSTLRDTLRKKLAGRSEVREPASAEKKALAEKNQRIGDKEHIEPLRDAIFSSNDGNQELTLFDVVHLRYVKLTPRMHR